VVLLNDERPAWLLQQHKFGQLWQSGFNSMADLLTG
jgi:hypothetical protein